ncbi:MAG: glycerol-3-phosphate acyltransferase [Candidatus Bipolaricaulia bacterium]
MWAFLWVGVGLLLGAMPFSVWLGRLFLDDDIRRYGDGNPGAINLWRAGGWRLGLPAVLLDGLKGALFVGLAHSRYGIPGWSLVPVALAPVVGHAFSPFLRFCGGKAVAVTFGVWTGLTLWEGPTILGASIGLFSLIQANDAWAVLLGMLGLGSYLAARQFDGVALAIWGGNLLLLIWKHRHELGRRPRLRPWLANLTRGSP